MKYLSLLLVAFITGCAGIPENVRPVDNFELERYLGKWYEIARLDHSFERGLTRVTAHIFGVRVKTKVWRRSGHVLNNLRAMNKYLTAKSSVEMKYLSLLLVAFITGCAGIPENVRPVDNFELERYLGKWYEIARLDHSFERGLTRVTAEYGLRDDGGVRVLNRGYSAKDDAWKTAEGKAYFVEGADRGYLKVSFFGPFYGSYVVFGLDHEHYQYSLVSGPSKSYLWILARKPVLDEDITTMLTEKAKAAGFDTDKLIFVEQ